MLRLTPPPNPLPVHGEGEQISAVRTLTQSPDIYDNTFLKALFDEMQSTYERVSTITSFGFNRRWRQQMTDRIGLRRGLQISDLMTGSGETWMYVLPRIGDGGTLTAVDFSDEMVKQAEARRCELGVRNVVVLQEDCLCTSLATGSLDAVVCAYGVKTLSPTGQRQFVVEIRRILKPGGVFGLVEVSVPEFALLRLPYLFYLTAIIPIFGRLLLGNPDNYRMLGVYTAKFGNCRELGKLFAANGFDVQYQRYFWGCASGVVGVKV